jgi:hypothetical protein
VHHVLREHLLDLLRDHTSHPDILDATQAKPVLRVLVRLDPDELHPLHQVVVVDVFDFALDANI